jgi:tryptophan 2-monooxygenase
MAWLCPSVKASKPSGTEDTFYYRYVDTPQLSYAKWRDDSGELIGTFPEKPRHKVAVIGAGLGGLAAAYELLKCGVEVTVIEASGRTGGRLYSKRFEDGKPEIAELGAMRFPPSEELLFRYISQFGIETKNDFPDPGTVPTLIGYKDRLYNMDGSTPPAEFATVHAGWNALMSDGATVTYTDPSGIQQTVKLAAPNDIAAALKTDKNGVPTNTQIDPRTAWADWLRVFVNKSLFNGLLMIFNGANPPGGKRWAYPEDYERFASLGAGFGGFGPLYQVEFPEIIRLVVNGLESDQMLVPGGIEQVADKLTNSSIQQPDGREVCVRDFTQLSTAVTGVYKVDGKIVVLGEGGVPVQGSPFDRVIVATTQRSMEIDSDIGLFRPFELPGIGTANPTLPSEVAQAVRDIHIMNSSKVFIRTKDKFWESLPNKTRAILSDSLSANLYTLDYGGENGVVLVSYVWGDQSIKQISFQDKRARLDILRAAIANYDPAFAAQLHPMDDDYENNLQMIDWELEPYYYGAFKLTRPGQDHYVQSAFYHFQDAALADDGQVFMAGDSISWTGGWTEGALQTAMNAACAVITSMGGTLTNPINPLTALQSDTYSYDDTTA